MERIPHFDERVRVGRKEAEVERFLERAGTPFAQFLRDVVAVP